MGLNANQMADFQQELQPQDQVVMQNNWDAWPEVNQGENVFQHVDEEQPVVEDQQQESISFDQSGSSALRATGPDIVLNLEDVLAGTVQASDSSSSSTKEVTSSDFQQSQCFLSTQFQAFEMQAFEKL